MTSDARGLNFEQGWPVLQEGVHKLIDIIEGVRYDQFSSEEYMILYHTCYTISNWGHDEAQKLYDQYKKTFEDYITFKVLPYLREKKGESLLQELVKRWNNHKLMARWLSRFFHYLDRASVVGNRLPALQAASYLTFYKLVYEEMNDQVRNALLSMINHEREGGQIDQALVKNVLDIYVEMGEGYYEKYFEEALLNHTTTFYSQNAPIWITRVSYEEYIIKVVEHVLFSAFARKQEEDNQLRKKLEGLSI